MISKFELPYIFKGEMNAITKGNCELVNGSTVKLKIPQIMVKLSGNSTSGSSIEPTSGNGIFKNANRKPALTSKTLKSQDYLTATLRNSRDAKDMNKTVKDLTGNIFNYNYTLQSGSPVRAEFLNNKLSKLRFSVTSDSKVTNNVNKNGYHIVIRPDD